MAHPLLGLPPADATAGRPAARRPAAGSTSPPVAAWRSRRPCASTPPSGTAYDDLALRRILRDDDRHIEQLARALETGEERFVTDYGEHIVPIYRRRDIRMNDYVTILGGLREAALSVLAGRRRGPDDPAHRPLDRSCPPSSAARR